MHKTFALWGKLLNGGALEMASNSHLRQKAGLFATSIISQGFIEKRAH